MGSTNKPYKSFGEELKRLRAKFMKTPAEVSGAVEIEESRLKSFEEGEDRPTEDILMLIIQHFDLADEQAASLWKLAGYGGKPSEEHVFSNADFIEMPQINITTSDSRIIYTDMIQVMANNYGVVLNFLQGAGAGNQPLAVSRIGMSKEHARSVVDILQKTLDQLDNPPSPKQLPTSTENRKKQQ